MVDDLDLTALRDRLDRLVDVIRDGHLGLLGATFETASRPEWLADPEVVASLLDDRASARVFQEFGTWLDANDKLFSPARLRAWSSVLPRARAPVEDLLARARENSRERQLAPVDMRIPALRRLRLRSLLGSGSRVEIVITLAVAPAATKNLAKLTGFTEQALRVELRSLATARWLDPAGTHPEAYYLSAELADTIGRLPDRAEIPWLHVVATTRRLDAVLDYLAADDRGAQLEAFAHLRDCAFLDRATKVSWGQRELVTPVSMAGLSAGVANVLAELERLVE